ncbi:MAG: Phenolic acid decarboxylase subunit C [Methanobacteriota archaeon]|nr:MAG: Phenolic acid decarboxylase subunit C [Euryarchaeota archaeon]
MAFRDHLKSAKTDSRKLADFNELPKISKTYSEQPIILNGFESDINCQLALDICQISVIADTLGIKESELSDLIGLGISNPKDPKLITKEEAKVLENNLKVVDLSKLPIPQYFPIDAGKYLTSAMVFVMDEGVSNASFHRMLVIDKNKMAIRIVPRHLHKIIHKNREKGNSTKIAIVMGADPFVLLSAAISFDFECEEIKVASSLHAEGYGKDLEVVELENGVIVPANAEFVMIAEILVDDISEGPFVDITGTKDKIREQPIVLVEKIYHRTEPYFHALIPAGIEHQTLMGLPRTPTIKNEVNKVTKCLDVRLMKAGSGWLSATVSIEKKGDDEAKKAIDATFRGHPSLKKVVVVDGDIDVGDGENVEWAVLTRSQPDRDYYIYKNQKGSSLDPTRYPDGTTSKIGIDATIPVTEDKGEFLNYR